MKGSVYLRICFYTITASLLLVSAACSNQNGTARTILGTANALVMDHPEAALDTLMTLNSKSVAGFNRSDKVFYNLLLTEAKYKSYCPVAQDSAIFNVVDYYRKKGLDELLVRALMMQGAVYEERLDPVKALESYKEAEPIAITCGNDEQLGILETRIGEVYQVSFINGQNAVDHYLKSLECFEKIKNENRIMHTLLALSKVYLAIDSVSVSEKYLKDGLNLANKFADRICLLGGYELATHLYQLKSDFRSVIAATGEAMSILGEEPQNNIEGDFYTIILNNCAKSYARLGQPDSARMFASRLPLENQSDSLVFYAVNRDIATAEGDWREAFDCQREAHRIEDEMKQASYDAQLVEVERKYENSVLREQLYERNNRILVLVLVYAGISLAAAGAFLLLRRLLRRQKAEIDRQAGIVRKLHDTASRLERDLRSKASEADALKAEKQQEEEARRDLEAMLTRQSSSNQELMRYYGKAQKAMRDIVNIYDARSSNPRHFMDDALEVARGFIVEMNSPGNATTLIETAYPGFLERLFEEFPGLSEEDRHLIILTCCGYPNGAVCTILGISESNLAVRKTRLAHRMGIDTSLAKFLRRRLVANPA